MTLSSLVLQQFELLLLTTINAFIDRLFAHVAHNTVTVFDNQQCVLRQLLLN